MRDSGPSTCGAGDRDAPIGVFDSGVGGLTVLAAIHARLPGESTLYLGDTARVPYGPKSPETVRRYTTEAAAFLLDRGVKALVIACNTATAHAADRLADSLDIPVLGVIRPGAAEAARRTRGGPVGVIGTQGTVDSGSYERAIRDLLPEATIRSVACPLFVALAEEGWVEGEVPRLTAERYLRPLLEGAVDTLVLGCTHYPLLKPLIARVAGPAVELVDSAESTARLLAELLEERQLTRESEDPSVRECFVTDDITRFEAAARRFLGGPLPHLEVIDFDETDLV